MNRAPHYVAFVINDTLLKEFIEQFLVLRVPFSLLLDRMIVRFEHLVLKQELLSIFIEQVFLFFYFLHLLS